MVLWPNLPREALEDCFRPPEEPCEVKCIHCGQQYCSTKIAWGLDDSGQGFWRCPVEGCDGAGFGLDIHPVDQALWMDDEGDEEDALWEEEFDDEVEDEFASVFEEPEVEDAADCLGPEFPFPLLDRDEDVRLN